MELLIYLVMAARHLSLAAGLPQYQPPSSPQLYQGLAPTPAYPSGRGAHPPAEHRKPMYTYAEVNTPYYQYHYYSPVYKTYPSNPDPFDTSSPAYPGRNEVPGRPTTQLNLFYPAPTRTSISPSGFDIRNREYTPQLNFMKPLLSSTPSNTREVIITSKPVLVKNAYAPTFKSYQTTTNANNVDLKNPIFTPTELASVFPNIIREISGKVNVPGETLGSQNGSFQPDLIVPANINSRPFGKPLILPEILATPSSTIIKDEMRRGVPPGLVFRDLVSMPPENLTVGKSLLNSTNSTSQLTPESTTLFEFYSESSFIADNGIPADVEHNHFINNIDHLTKQPSNSSAVAISESTILEDSADNFSTPLMKPMDQHTVKASTEKPDKTFTHLQKIAKKVNQAAVSKKKAVLKYPNALFYSPGHDIPV